MRSGESGLAIILPCVFASRRRMPISTPLRVPSGTICACCVAVISAAMKFPLSSHSKSEMLACKEACEGQVPASSLSALRADSAAGLSGLALMAASKALFARVIVQLLIDHAEVIPIRGIVRNLLNRIFQKRSGAGVGARLVISPGERVGGIWQIVQA